MADVVGLDNVQTGTLQFITIDRELFSTSLYRYIFIIIIIDNRQTSKKTRTWVN